MKFKAAVSSLFHGTWLFFLTFLICPCPIHSLLIASVGGVALVGGNKILKKKKCASKSCEDC